MCASRSRSRRAERVRFRAASSSLAQLSDSPRVRARGLTCSSLRMTSCLWGMRCVCDVQRGLRLWSENLQIRIGAGGRRGAEERVRIPRGACGTVRQSRLYLSVCDAAVRLCGRAEALRKNVSRHDLDDFARRSDLCAARSTQQRQRRGTHSDGAGCAQSSIVAARPDPAALAAQHRRAESRIRALRLRLCICSSSNFIPPRPATRKGRPLSSCMLT